MTADTATAIVRIPKSHDLRRRRSDPSAAPRLSRLGEWVFGGVTADQTYLLLGH